MQPVSPVVPGQKLDEIIVAEHQEEYQNLPVVAFENGVVLSRWQLTDEEKAVVKVHGTIFICLMHFGTVPPETFFQTEMPIVNRNGSQTSITVGDGYVGTDHPVIYHDEKIVWVRLNLTERDKAIVADHGNIYVFMFTEEKPITPHLLQVETPEAEFAEVGFITSLRYTSEREERAAEFGIKTQKDKCSECSSEVIISGGSLEIMKTRGGMKIICLECAQEKSAEFYVLPETAEQLKNALNFRNS